jgi:hypothetical protein
MQALSLEEKVRSLLWKGLFNLRSPPPGAIQGIPEDGSGWFYRLVRHDKTEAF